MNPGLGIRRERARNQPNICATSGLFRRPAQFVDEVGAFPGEGAIRLRRAAEMAET
jgi:hypothetical protein